MGESLQQKSPERAGATLRTAVNTLRTRVESAQTRAAERQRKLEEALRTATSFRDDMQTFTQWLTEKERALHHWRAPSRVLDTVTEQIETHRALQQEIAARREMMQRLDKVGTHLKYFSQKQDALLVRNSLASAQHRWDKLLSRAAERTRQLDVAFKDAKRFAETWGNLLQWIEDQERQLDADGANVPSDSDKIKQQLSKHKEFQRALGAKQPAFDLLQRRGKMLREKAPKSDAPVLGEMLGEARQKWARLCARSVERQRALEEALLFSGQFKDALQALLDWLTRVEPQLGEQQRLHGDVDTVGLVAGGNTAHSIRSSPTAASRRRRSNAQPQS